MVVVFQVFLKRSSSWCFDHSMSGLPVSFLCSYSHAPHSDVSRLTTDRIYDVGPIIFPCGAAAQRGPRPPHSRGFYITHNDAPQSVGLLWTSDRLVAETSTWQHNTHNRQTSIGLLWTSDRLVAETSPWQHTILTTDRHLCPRWDSNPWSQQANGRRPTP